MNIFARLMKVDVARREVWGRAVHEEIDKSGEIFDYENSKPFFKSWSDEYAKLTDGQSVGNLRAMHGKVAAGKLIAIDFNDAAKAIDIGTKIVDDAEWQKVTEGVYTGFSIGGEYVGEKVTEKIGDAEVKRYVAKPSEISLVDNPCGPSARFFDVLKADGVIEKVAFKVQPTEAKPEDDKTLDVTGSAEDVAAFAKLLNDGKLTMKDALAAVQDEIAKRDFSQKERDKAAESGAAMPDGSYPIENASDLKNAIQAYGRAKNPAKTKAHIIARAKALGHTDLLPDDWKKISDADFSKMDKGMWNVKAFAECLECLAGIAMSAESDAQYEGDDSPVPAALREWVATGVKLFQDMSEEESSELVAALSEHAGEDVEMMRALRGASAISKLRAELDAATEPEAFRKIVAAHISAEELLGTVAAWKSETGVDGMRKLMRDAVLAKAGARHSSSDKTHLQNAHNSLVALGADCSGGEKAHGNVDLVKGGTLAKQVETLTAEVAALKAQPLPTQRVRLRTVEKVQDVETPADEITAEKLLKEAVRNADGSINEAATIIKFAQATGGVSIDPRRRAK